MTAAAVLLAALLLLAGGCGGDDDGEPVAGQAPAAEESIAAPDAEPIPDDGAPADHPEEGAAEQRTTGDPPAERRISRAQFVARADRLCTRKRRELAQDLADRVQGAERSGIVDPYSDALTKMMREIADGVAALPEPRSGPPPTQFVEAQRRYASLLEQLREGVGSIDQQGRGDIDQDRLRRLAGEMQRAVRQVASRAEEQGFKVCGGI